MKTLKRMLAVMLAVVMMMGLGVTSMAATTEDSNKVTVHVTIQNPDNASKNIFEGNVTVDKDTTLYTLEDAATIENYGKATAMDALIATGETITYHKVQYLDTDTWEPIDQYGIAFDSINGKAGTSVKNTDGSTTYQYWELCINGPSASNYATNYVLTEGMNITVKWSSMTY